MKRKVIIGSLGSRLALIKAESVVAKLREAYPDLEISISKVLTGGDRDQQTSLDRIGKVGDIR